MASSVDLVVRVLGDVSNARASCTGLGKDLSGLIGVGVAGGAVAQIVQVGADFETAMSKIQIANNNIDFAPGTAKYGAAKDQITKFSTELAASFEDVAASYSQGARFVDDFGNKLSTDKLNEYTDTMIRLSKVSTDALSPTDIGQRVDVFEKLHGQTNFAAVGSAVAAESLIHNQGEGPMLDTAIAIAQAGASMGVTQAESGSHLQGRGPSRGPVGLPPDATRL